LSRENSEGSLANFLGILRNIVAGSDDGEEDDEGGQLEGV